MSIPTEIFCYPETLDDVWKQLETHKEKLEDIKNNRPWEHELIWILETWINDIEVDPEEYLSGSIARDIEEFYKLSI